MGRPWVLRPTDHYMKARLLDAGLTITEAAKYLEVPAGTLGDWLAGRSFMPTEHVVDLEVLIGQTEAISSWPALRS